MEIELTEKLWDTLNPEPHQQPGEPFGTTWILRPEQFFTMWYATKGEGILYKVFAYHDSRLEQPIVIRIDATSGTAGSIHINENSICLTYLDRKCLIWDRNVVEGNFQQNEA